MHKISFKRFLNENSNPSYTEILEMIKRDCEQWMSTHGDSIKLYRGISGADLTSSEGGMTRQVSPGLYGKDILIGSVRNNRMPRDISKIAHYNMDAIFKERVGIPLRSASLFVAKDPSGLNHYGKVYQIFPIGEYHYAWSPYMHDPYSVFVDRDFSEDHLKVVIGDVLPQVNEKFKTNYKRVSELTYANDQHIAYALSLVPDMWYFDEHIDKADGNTEIMLVCDKYYAISADIEVEF